MTEENPTILLASPEPALLRRLEEMLLAQGGPRVEVVLSADTALAAMTDAPLKLVLLDVNLPGFATGQLLARARLACGNRFPIVLIADDARQEWIDRMAEGVVDDVILRVQDAPYWQLRIGMALHTHEIGRELDALRETAARNAQLDRLTGVYNRETLLAMLSREITRVQRTKNPLSLLLFDIDDFGHWNSRLGSACCDQLLCQVAGRASKLLRAYDLIGRPGKDEFLLALPDCSALDAVALAERLRREAFCEPFQVSGDSIRLSACFGIASCNGRPPEVTLCEAEQALAWAKNAGPESVECFGQAPEPEVSPVTFLSAKSGDKLLAW
jgi:two-component system cell cycle response regulator